MQDFASLPHNFVKIKIFPFKNIYLCLETNLVREMKYFACLFLLIFMACGEENPQQNKENPQQKIEDLQKEVIAIHDAVMPKMDDIMALKLKIENKIDSVNAEQKLILEQQLAQLEKGSQAMKNWMMNYRIPKKDAAFENAKNYLLAQKDSITAVKNIMLEAIKNAQNTLK